ncbi:CHAP domain-containing protein [Actinomadura montaniterrae]|nr:CHAP domain-containing protein [Actinomadura montaniterrae]
MDSNIVLPDVLAGPTEPDEEQVLRALYGPPSPDGAYRASARAAAVGTSGAMLEQARRSLGIAGRPNVITREYANRHGADYLRTSWCDMSITYWARHGGCTAAVLPGGDRAYTVWHAQDFQKIGRWHAGTTANVNDCKPGDIVFFDWNGTDSVGAIDHVGVVEKVLGGGRVQTIEGNTSDSCARRVRSAGVIAGYGRPAYAGAASDWQEVMVQKLPELKKGSTGEHVQSVQGLLLARSHPKIKVDGKFGDSTDKAVRAVQKWGGVDVDGVVGPVTWSVLLRVH